MTEQQVMSQGDVLQVLHIIRHGESEYNAASRVSREFVDPQIFNPKLTEKGRREVHHPHFSIGSESMHSCGQSVSGYTD